MKESDSAAVIATLNEILKLELAGVVRYSHYSLMIFGHARIPSSRDAEPGHGGVAHAVTAGEYVTALGGHQSLAIGKLLETHKHDIDQILREALEHELEGIAAYKKLLKQTEGKSVVLEEYARQMVHGEETHVMDIEKMLPPRGSSSRFAEARRAQPKSMESTIAPRRSAPRTG